MYNEALTSLKAQIFPADIADCAGLKTQFKQHLDTALDGVIASDYVEDCLFQIEEALERLCQSDDNNLDLRTYLLGAIEALRDELHLCDVNVDVRQAAIGF
jgi:translation initiation factor IF-2